MLPRHYFPGYPAAAGDTSAYDSHNDPIETIAQEYKLKHDVDHTNPEMLGRYAALYGLSFQPDEEADVAEGLTPTASQSDSPQTQFSNNSSSYSSLNTIIMSANHSSDMASSSSPSIGYIPSVALQTLSTVVASVFEPQVDLSAFRINAEATKPEEIKSTEAKTKRVRKKPQSKPRRPEENHAYYKTLQSENAIFRDLIGKLGELVENHKKHTKWLDGELASVKKELEESNVKYARLVERKRKKSNTVFVSETKPAKKKTTSSVLSQNPVTFFKPSSSTPQAILRPLAELSRASMK